MGGKGSKEGPNSSIFSRSFSISAKSSECKRCAVSSIVNLALFHGPYSYRQVNLCYQARATGARASGPKDSGRSCIRSVYDSSTRGYTLTCSSLRIEKAPSLSNINIGVSSSTNSRILSPSISHDILGLPPICHHTASAEHPKEGRNTNNCLHMPHGLAGGEISVLTATALNVFG